MHYIFHTHVYKGYWTQAHGSRRELGCYMYKRMHKMMKQCAMMKQFSYKMLKEIDGSAKNNEALKQQLVLYSLVQNILDITIKQFTCTRSCAGYSYVNFAAQ